MPDDRFDALVDRIYEAAVVPDRWPGVLDGLAEIGDGVGGLLFASDGGATRWTSSPSLLQRFTRYVAEGWPARTDRAQRLIGARYAGFLSDLDVYTQEEIEREPVYVEFLRPNGIGWGAGTAIPIPTGDMIFVTVERASGKGPPERETLDRLDGLRAHLARAALVAARLGLERARTAAETMAMLGLPGGVLAGGGRLIAVNRLLEALIPTVAADQRERLRIADSGADALFADACQRIDHAGAGGVFSIPLRAAPNNPPMIMHLIPVRGAANDVFSGASSLFIVTPVETRRVPNAEVLQGLFDLTPAEARVARGIAEGETLEGIARAHDLSRETVRSQLKATLAKTGLGRQADLARLLSGIMTPPSG